MDEISYNGSHGTSMSRCESIKTTSFRVSAGRGGTGVYFWKESRLYLQLAKAWFEHEKNRGSYKNEHGTQGVVIVAALKVKNIEFLDLEEQEFKDMIVDVSIQMGIDLNNTDKLARLNDVVVKRFEKKSGHTIKMYTVRVAPPKFCTFKYPIRALGAPVCCVARTSDIITIVSCHPCNEV